METTRVEVVGDVAVVHLTRTKYIEDAEITRLGQEIQALVDTLGHRKIVLDFSGVDFISSAVLGKFITLDRKLGTLGGTSLRMCTMVDGIYEVLAITKLDRQFHIHSTLQDALNSF